jgi:IS30 family transposase
MRKKITNKQIVEVLGQYKKGISDGVKRKGNAYAYRKGFFYAHGQTAEAVANEVKESLAKAGIQATILSKQEHWNPWPRDSYWEVIFKQGD